MLYNRPNLLLCGVEASHFDLISSHIMTALIANIVSKNKSAKSNATRRPKSPENPPAYEEDENLLVIGIDFGTT